MTFKNSLIIATTFPKLIKLNTEKQTEFEIKSLVAQMKCDMREKFLYSFFTNGAFGIYDFKTAQILKMR